MKQTYILLCAISILFTSCGESASTSPVLAECAQPAVRLAYPLAYDEEGVPTPQPMPQFLPSAPYWVSSFLLAEEVKKTLGEDLVAATIGELGTDRFGNDIAWVYYQTSQKGNSLTPSLLQVDLSTGKLLGVYDGSSEGERLPNRLFQLKNGGLWGTNFQNLLEGEKVSILYTYNEITDQFEAVLDEANSLTNESGPINVIPDDYRNVLWISRYEYDEFRVYKFDPSTYRLQEDSTLSNLGGSFVIGSKELLWVFYEKEENQFVASYNPDTSELKEYWTRPLEINRELKTPIFFDHEERLWFGDSAWLDTSQSPPLWYELVPSPYFISPNPVPFVPYKASRPYSMFESSNGQFWFEGPQGLVRLNPSNGQWCLMTTVRGQVNEDSQKNLWFLANGTLYKHSLKP